MLILLFEKHLIWSGSDAVGRTTYYYYDDRITWAVLIVAAIWIAWLLIRRHRLSRAQQSSGRKPVPRRVVRLKEELSSKYLATSSSNLHAIGIGLGADDNYCIQFFVSDATEELCPDAGATKLPESYKGVPLLLVECPRATLAATVAADLQQTVQTGLDLREYQQVIVGGVSGANMNLAGQNGTLGFFCRSRSWTNRSVYVLSNSHVLVDAQGVPPRDTDLIVQPSPGETDEGQPIGTLTSYLPLRFSNPNYPTTNLNAVANYMDAAIATLNSGQLYQAVIPWIGAVRGYLLRQNVVPGVRVRKVGRTTGFTAGYITSVRVNAWITTSYGQSAYFKDQFMIEPASPYADFVLNGDSGSLVVEPSNRAIGLICARGYVERRVPSGGGTVTVISSYALTNPISQILDKFGIDLLTY